MNKNKPKHTKLLLQYASVGMIGTALHYLTLIFLVEALHIDSVISTTAGFIIGAIFNYLTSFKYVFKSAKKHTETAPKFIAIAIVTGVLNSLVMWVLAVELGIYYLVAQIVATGLAFIFNYLLNANWTFQ